MLFFMNDYGQAAHPRIIKAVEETNGKNIDGYGIDDYSERAKKTIRELIGKPDAHIHFMIGGTPTNVATIAQLLKPYEGVVCPRTAHIYRHETGAVEATGHKLITAITDDGKLTPEIIKGLLAEFEDEHTVLPKMVFISDTTEIGTVYTKKELTDLSKFCRQNGLYLFLDGARLGAALTCEDNDLTIKEIADLVDVFYIGGTKNGLLMGEALVFVNTKLDENFRFIMKNKNGMLAKGWLLGAQFEELLKGGDDSLFYELARQENKMALLLRKGLEKKGYKLLGDSKTNQIFPIITLEQDKMLREKVMFEPFRQIDDKYTCVRFCTGYYTTEEDINALLDLL